MQTKHKLASIGLAVLMSLSAAPSFAQVMVGGAPMLASKDIIDNAVNSKDHTTLVAAVKAAGLVDTLKSAGPFTVFAPTNEAFGMLPAGTVDNLLKPEMKAGLTGVLTYHVVAGKMSAEDLAMKAKEMGGKVELKTVNGGMITIQSDGKDGWDVVDANGGKAHITIANVFQSNGVIHVIDHVLLPKG